MEQDLVSLKCQPYGDDTPPLTPEQTATYLPLIAPQWKVIRGKKLRRGFQWRNFLRSMLFVNAMAYLAEQEDHHPDMTIKYSTVVVELSTHSVGGLSKNDFIMAAKIDRLAAEGP